MEFQDYGFKASYINEGAEEYAANNCNHTYSKLLDVVFVRRLCICPFIFKTKIEPPSGSYIRAVSVLRNSQIPIQRCSRHLNHEYTPDSVSDRTSFMRCHDPNAIYETTSEGHTSIIFPVGSFIHEGSILSGKVESFEFLCSNHCVGDKQKSPLMFILTLENDYVVLSRQVININISASPGRDRRNWEKSVLLASNKSLETSSSSCQTKKRKSCEDKATVADSTSCESSVAQHDSMDVRIREGLAALEAVPKQVIDYYKQQRQQRLSDTQPSSWPVCQSCYQTLDIQAQQCSTMPSNITDTFKSVRYTLRRTVVSLEYKVRNS